MRECVHARAYVVCECVRACLCPRVYVCACASVRTPIPSSPHLSLSLSLSLTVWSRWSSSRSCHHRTRRPIRNTLVCGSRNRGVRGGTGDAAQGIHRRTSRSDGILRFHTPTVGSHHPSRRTSRSTLSTVSYFVRVATALKMGTSLSWFLCSTDTPTYKYS